MTAYAYAFAAGAFARAAFDRGAPTLLRRLALSVVVGALWPCVVVHAIAYWSLRELDKGGRL